MTRRVFAAGILPPNVDGLPLLRPVGGRRLRFASFGEISVTTVPSVRVCLILLFPLLPSSSFKLVLFLLLLLTLDMERFFAAGLERVPYATAPGACRRPSNCERLWEAKGFRWRQWSYSLWAHIIRNIDIYRVDSLVDCLKSQLVPDQKR